MEIKGHPEMIRLNINDKAVFSVGVCSALDWTLTSHHDQKLITETYQGIRGHFSINCILTQRLLQRKATFELDVPGHCLVR